MNSLNHNETYFSFVPFCWVSTDLRKAKNIQHEIFFTKYKNKHIFGDYHQTFTNIDLVVSGSTFWALHLV